MSSFIQRALSVEEARIKLIAAARPIPQVEKLAVPEGLNRMLSTAVYAEVDVPPAANSAMDGYAVLHVDAEAAGFQLPVNHRIAAGSVPEPLVPSTAVRIFSGGVVPTGADTVAIQENCRQPGNEVALDPGVKMGANIRPRGRQSRLRILCCSILAAVISARIRGAGHDQ